MVVAPGRMIDSFLPIPDAESLPIYRMVLKLACACARARVCRATYTVCLATRAPARAGGLNGGGGSTATRGIMRLFSAKISGWGMTIR